MQHSNEDLDDETYVPLKDKKNAQNKRVGFLVLSLILLGAAMVLSFVMILRSGGLPRILFVGLTILLGYIIYDAIMKYRSINK